MPGSPHTSDSQRSVPVRSWLHLPARPGSIRPGPARAPLLSILSQPASGQPLGPHAGPQPATGSRRIRSLSRVVAPDRCSRLRRSAHADRRSPAAQRQRGSSEGGRELARRRRRKAFATVSVSAPASPSCCHEFRSVPRGSDPADRLAGDRGAVFRRYGMIQLRLHASVGEYMFPRVPANPIRSRALLWIS